MEKFEKVWEYDGKKYIFTMPTVGQSNAANLEYSKAYTDAIKNGLMPRVIIEKDYKEKGIWTDADEQKIKDELGKLQDNVVILKASKDETEIAKAREDFNLAQNSYVELFNRKQELFQHSADSKGDAAKNIELTWRCVLAEDRTPIWKSRDEFFLQQDEKLLKQIVNALFVFTSGLEEQINSLDDFMRTIGNSEDKKVEEG